MARNRNKSSTRNKARQTPAAQPRARQEAPAEEPRAGGTPNRALWIAAAVAAAIVLGAGVLFALYGSPTKSPGEGGRSAQALSFVGGETCA